MEQHVGVRQLKSKLSEILRWVRDGETVVITMHGKPVGRIVPYERSLEQKLGDMVASGAASWSGRHLPAALPDELPVTKGNRTVADLVIEDRR